VDALVLVDEVALTEGAKNRYKEWNEEISGEVKCTGYMFEEFHLEEMYIDSEGDMEITFYTGKGDECSGIYVSVTIKFDEWFSEFIRHKSFDDLIKLLDKRLHDLEKVIDIIKGIKIIVNKAKEMGRV
jgi:hypothetical protein